MKSKYIYFAIAAFLVSLAIYPVAFAQLSNYAQSGNPYMCAPLVPCQQPPAGSIACGTACVITMKDNSFVPGTINATVGDKIVWVNHDGYSHTTTSFNASAWSSPIIPPGGSFSFTVNLAPGKYYYYCKFHPFMIGVLNVLPVTKSS
jgi:plastocyanin